ncbi:MAG TPA: ABC transporter substrate-binding protein [Egibacteraceae bacterium]|jgi:branched-chain amino acid transport system substrate-binding protein|nr:ABC transporter substrate-binding protein [Egibacteraceae bacterium]
MRMWRRYGKAAFVAACALALAACGGGGGGGAGADVVRVGINAEITGSIPKVGEQTRHAAEMFVEELNNAGGVDLGDRQVTLELVIEDNGATPEGAAAASTKLITQDNVAVIVGANASAQAIPAAEVADANATPIISPWSTNPDTTAGRPYAFRVPFLDDFQGPVIANFVEEEFGFERAAVLYDVGSDYPKGLAEFFTQAWEEDGHEVVATETFTTGDSDFSAQLTSIRNSGADFLFTPQYYNEVPLIVSQARSLGIDVPIMGSDSWSDPQTLELCGEECEGTFFSAHYVPAGATGSTKEFIDAYEERYGEIPGDVAALTWDAMQIVVEGIRNCGEITGEVATDRDCIRDGMAAIEELEGITGTMSFDDEGDPVKCAVIARIEEGDFVFHQEVCP